MKPFLENTPLSAAVEGKDPPAVVEAAKTTGGRPAHDYEIASLVGLLCMPEAGFTTGSVLCANGGMTFTS
jgi:NAD(P)-dependent dehydrogenase (short-subunit alcohol dehydrogenase family)